MRVTALVLMQSRELAEFEAGRGWFPSAEVLSASECGNRDNQEVALARVPGELMLVSAGVNSAGK
jgi:hypothetical protein